MLLFIILIFVTSQIEFKNYLQNKVKLGVKRKINFKRKQPKWYFGKCNEIEGQVLLHRGRAYEG